MADLARNLIREENPKSQSICDFFNSSLMPD